MSCSVCGRDYFLVHSVETICYVCLDWSIYVETQLKNERYAKNLVDSTKEEGCAHLVKQNTM